MNECREKVFFHLNNGQIDSVQFWVYQGLNYLRNEEIDDNLLIGKQYNLLFYIEGLLGHKMTAINFADSAILYLESADTLTDDILFSYHSKGQSYQKLGDFYRANVALEMALYVADSLKDQKKKNGILNDLASNEMHIGNLSKAEVYFKMIIADQETPLWLRIICQANLTDLYLDFGQLFKARTTWENVEKYIQADGIEENPLFPDFLKIKAHLQQEEGLRRQSIETLNKAIDLLEKRSLEKSKLGKFRCDLVSLLLEENLDIAKEECRKAYDSFNAQDQALKDPHQMVVTHLMAQVFYQQYRKDNQEYLLDSCLFYCKKAQEVSDLLREGFLYRNSKYQLAEYLKANIELGLDVAFELIEKGQVDRGQKLFFYFIEKGKSQVLLDELGERQQARLKANGVLEQLYTLELKKMETEDSIAKIMLSNQIEKTKKVLKVDGTNISDEERWFRPDLKRLLQLSKQSNIVFLEFGEGGEYPYVLVINHGRFTQRRIAISKDSLGVLVKTHLDHIKSSTTPLSDYVVTASNLYALLLEPLKIEQENVIIIPSELVAHLPFSSLVTSSLVTSSYKQLPYALKKWNFSYAFSSTFLSDLQADMKQSFCGLLPMNQQEGDLSTHKGLMNKIEDRFGGVYYQNETFPGLSSIAEQHDFIHISSHGTFSIESPENSYLFMPGSDSSRLTIEQLYSTTMSKAPFVVLNACETGEGEVRSGEGIDNFTRAFFYSGASGVVESSWKINADQTASIFSHFYNSLFDGEKTNMALRKAKLAYLNDQSTDDHFAHPYYWAGFRHFGAVVTLQKSVSLISYWVIISLIATLLAFVWWNKRRGSRNFR